jgi:hypothetical protein
MDKRNPSASITPVVKRRTQPSVDKYIEATGSALVAGRPYWGSA